MSEVMEWGKAIGLASRRGEFTEEAKEAASVFWSCAVAEQSEKVVGKVVNQRILSQKAWDLGFEFWHAVEDNNFDQCRKVRAKIKKLKEEDFDSNNDGDFEK